MKKICCNIPRQQAPVAVAGYGAGGPFFPAQQPAAPVGGMTPDQMMQVMQQNPYFAAQVVTMMNHFQAMNMQQPPQGHNSREPRFGK